MIILTISKNKKRRSTSIYACNDSQAGNFITFRSKGPVASYLTTAFIFNLVPNMVSSDNHIIFNTDTFSYKLSRRNILFKRISIHPVTRSFFETKRTKTSSDRNPKDVGTINKKVSSLVNKRTPLYRKDLHKKKIKSTSTSTNKIQGTPKFIKQTKVIGTLTKNKKLVKDTKPNLKNSKEFYLNGQIGNAQLGIYIPFIFDLLKGYYSQEEISMMITRMVKFHDELIKHHGILSGTKRFKDITLYCTQLLEGTKPTPLFNVSIGKVDRWPTCLGFLRPLFHSIRDYGSGKFGVDRSLVVSLRRFLLILFKINRVCCQYTHLEISSLRTNYKIDSETINAFTDFVNRKLESGIRKENLQALADSFIQPVFGPSKGPNGLPKEESIYAEAYHLKAKETAIYEGLKAIANKTKDIGFISYLDNCASQYNEAMLIAENSPKPRKGNIDIVNDIKLISPIRVRKLQAIPDVGNKSRTVAISDFWTQSLLSLIEKLVIKVTMSKYENECSFFGHSEGFDELKKLKVNNPDLLSELVSIDATDWSDNFPASLQMIVMNRIFGDDITSAWNSIAVRCNWNIGNTEATVSYGKGQGMGTKGSFAIAQLTNLLFISYIYETYYPFIPKPFFKEVGDDMVVQDPRGIFPREFEKIGVPMNLSKTKRTTLFGSFVEFVSRNSWDGEDYSIISPNLMLKYKNNDFYTLTLLEHLSERGIDLTLKDLFDFKDQFESICKKKKKDKERIVNTDHLDSRTIIFVLASLLNQSGLSNIKLGVTTDELNGYLNSDKIRQILKGLAVLNCVYDQFADIAKAENSLDNYFDGSELSVTLRNSVNIIENSASSFFLLAKDKGWSPVLLKSIITNYNLIKPDIRPISGVVLEPFIDYQKYVVESNKENNSCLEDYYSDVLVDSTTSIYIINPMWLRPLIEDIHTKIALLCDLKVARNLKITDKSNHRSYLKLMSRLSTIFTFDEVKDKNGGVSEYRFFLKGKPISIRNSFYTKLRAFRYKLDETLEKINSTTPNHLLIVPEKAIIIRNMVFSPNPLMDCTDTLHRKLWSLSGAPAYIGEPFEKEE